MLWYKDWRESRLRFLLSAGLVAGMCVFYTLLYRHLSPGVAHEHPAVHTYTQYIHWTVFGGTTRGMVQLSCLLLGLGGLQRDRKQDTLGFTLALPVSRVRLVVTRAMMGFAQVSMLALLAPLLVTGASALVGQQLPLSYGLHFAPLWIAGGVFTYGLSFLFSVLFTHEYVALAFSYMAYMFYLAGTRHPRVGRYHLHVADLMSGLLPGYLNRSTMLWGASYPIIPLVGFLGAGAVLVMLATWFTARQDL